MPNNCFHTQMLDMDSKVSGQQYFVKEHSLIGSDYFLSFQCYVWTAFVCRQSYITCQSTFVPESNISTSMNYGFRTEQTFGRNEENFLTVYSFF